MTLHAAAAAALALLCGALLAGTTVRVAAQESVPAEAEVDTAPVAVDGEVLFRVRGTSSLPAETRASRIRTRIEAAAADASIPLTALRVVANAADGFAWIMAGDRPLVAVTEADARFEQLTREELSATHLARIRQAIDEYRQARSPEAWGRNLRDAGVAAATFVLITVLVLLLNRWAHRLLARALAGRVAAVQIQSVSIVRAERIASALHQLLHLVVAGVLLVLAFAFLRFTLGLFPGTRHLADRLFDIVIGPLSTMGQAVVDQVPNLVFLAVLFLVFRIILRVLRLVFESLGRDAVHLRGFEPEWAGPTYKIVRFAVIAFALVIAYPYLPGSDSAAFKGVSLFIGVLFSLGSSSAISNLIAGYMLIYRKAFKVGDRVKIGDVVGDVTDSRIQVTRLRSLKNEEVVIPNSLILTGQVINYSALARTEGLILHTTVGIGYETPWRQVEAMLLEAASRTPGIMEKPAPFVLQQALADFAVNYELNVYCADAGRALEVYTDLHRQILDVFNEYGVQIMTPAYIADPAEPKIVPPSQWHAAPASPTDALHAGDAASRDVAAARLAQRSDR